MSDIILVSFNKKYNRWEADIGNSHDGDSFGYAYLLMKQGETVEQCIEKAKAKWGPDIAIEIEYSGGDEPK